jgi:RND family efflux transporter MFP subunit
VKRWIIGMVLAAVAVFAFAWTRKSAPKEVPVVKAVRAPLLSLISTNATAEPYEWRAVTAGMPGRIGHVLVKANDQVLAGRVLAMVDNPGLESEIAAAEANYQQAGVANDAVQRGGPARERAEIDALEAKLKTEIAAAIRERDVTARLVAKSAATPSELTAVSDRIVHLEVELKSIAARRAALVDTRDAMLTASRLNQAQKELAEVSSRERRSNLHAPIAGAIYELSVKAGDWVDPGKVLAKVGDLSKLRLRVFVDEPDLGRVSAGMKVKVSWDALPGENWEAVVNQIPSQVTAMGTRMVGEVIAEMANPGARIPSGANVNVEIEAEKVDGALTIPKEALRRKDGQLGVLAVEDGILKWRTIRTGISSLSSVQVVDGLKEGEAVVSSSDPQWVEGMKAAPVARPAGG